MFFDITKENTILLQEQLNFFKNVLQYKIDDYDYQHVKHLIIQIENELNKRGINEICKNT